jgi:hypothetical protein
VAPDASIISVAPHRGRNVRVRAVCHQRLDGVKIIHFRGKCERRPAFELTLVGRADSGLFLMETHIHVRAVRNKHLDGRLCSDFLRRVLSVVRIPHCGMQSGESRPPLRCHQMDE